MCFSVKQSYLNHLKSSCHHKRRGFRHTKLDSLADVSLFLRFILNSETIIILIHISVHFGTILHSPCLNSSSKVNTKTFIQTILRLFTFNMELWKGSLVFTSKCNTSIEFRWKNGTEHAVWMNCSMLLILHKFLHAESFISWNEYEQKH